MTDRAFSPEFKSSHPSTSLGASAALPSWNVLSSYWVSLLLLSLQGGGGLGHSGVLRNASYKY